MITSFQRNNQASKSAPGRSPQRPLAIEPLEDRCLLASDFGPIGAEFRVNSYTIGDQQGAALAVDAVGNTVVVWESLDGSGLGIFGQRLSSSGAPVGPEFRVNTYTTFSQQNPSVAMDGTGNFVVAWQSNGQDGSGGGIFAQRYNAIGATQGSEFQVNTHTPSGQTSPSVAMDSLGNFVVAWESLNQDGSILGVYAQRFNASGVAQGSEFLVNTYTTFSQLNPSVAMDSAGNFVVTWMSNGQDGFGYGIFAQRYNASGVAQGSEFQVNDFTTNSQRHPSAAMDSVGNFVVTWISQGQDGSGYGVYAQRYNAIGTPLGGEFQVNTYTPNSQLVPKVAMDSAGNFVVVWNSLGQDGAGYGVFAQRYDASGVPLGGEFQVNTLTTSSQSLPAVAVDSTGNLIVAWHSHLQDGSGNGIFAQRFGDRFVAVSAGSEFQVNTYTTNSQARPSVALDSVGNFVVAWHSQGQDGSGYGIYAQRFDFLGAPLGSEFQVNAYTTSGQGLPSVAMNRLGNFVVAWQSSIQDGAGYGIFAQRYNANGVMQGSEFQVNTHTTSSQISPSVAMDSAGNFVVTWSSYFQDGSGSGIYAQRYAANGAPQGGEFQVNTYTSSDQSAPSVAMDSLGNFLIAWNSYGQDGSGHGIYAQRFDALGVPLGSEFQVNSYTTNGQTFPKVAMDRTGNFVVVWQSIDQDGAGLGIFGQRYSADGIPQGSEFQVNTYTTNSQSFPSVAMDGVGNFVVAWQSLAQDGSIYGTYAQRYDSSGVPQGGEFQVNTYTTNSQGVPSVAMDISGNFVVAWQSFGQDGDGEGIFAQQYIRPVGVADVQVRGTTWDAGLPWYPIPVGNANQLQALPWSNVDQLRIVFSRPVTIASGDLELTGVNIPDYTGLISGFSYDPVTNAATWTFSSPIGADKLRIRLVSGVVLDAFGRPIDGEWTDGMSTYYSGDGTPGGTFAFRFNVLPGDVNGNGSVTTADVALARNRLFTTAGLPGFDLFSDVNGNGSVTTADVSQARNFLFTSLPAGDPAIAAAMPSIFLSAGSEWFEDSAAYARPAGRDGSSGEVSGLAEPQALGSRLKAGAVDAFFTQLEVVESGIGDGVAETNIANRDRNRLGSAEHPRLERGI